MSDQTYDKKNSRKSYSMKVPNFVHLELFFFFKRQRSDSKIIFYNLFNYIQYFLLPYRQNQIRLVQTRSKRFRSEYIYPDRSKPDQNYPNWFTLFQIVGTPIKLLYFIKHVQETSLNIFEISSNIFKRLHQTSPSTNSITKRPQIIKHHQAFIISKQDESC